LPAAFSAGAMADAATGVGLTRIGTVGEGEGVRFHADGLDLQLEGFRHPT
jgi:hypothetical protein